ncbi:MAG: hypothetical protein ACRDTF_16545 [Pseudonocardiaceae bacterium]
MGVADAEVLTEQITHLSKLGTQYGSGRVREQDARLILVILRTSPTVYSVRSRCNGNDLCGDVRRVRKARAV